MFCMCLIFCYQLSNVLFLLLPPVLMHLFRDYGRFVNPGIHVIWVLLMVVGLSSAYFHATLSLIGKCSLCNLTFFMSIDRHYLSH